MAEGKLAVLRRDRLWNTANGKPAFAFTLREDFIAQAGALLEDIQQGLFDEARERRDANITRGVTSFDEVAAFFAEDRARPGWVEVEWSRPTGAALAAVEERLKPLKLTIRNVPRDGAPAAGACIFTGEPAIERILLARAY
jgi:prolyl-tRNA synthetase